MKKKSQDEKDFKKDRKNRRNQPSLLDQGRIDRIAVDDFHRGWFGTR